MAASYQVIPIILDPISVIPSFSWIAVHCDNYLCPDAVALSSLLNSNMVIQYEQNGGLDRSPLDDFTHCQQMFQRPAL